MNKREYKKFMGCTRKVMRDTFAKMDRINQIFCWSDEDVEEAIRLSDTITAFGKQFYGREFSLSERRIFMDMYRG